MVEAEPPCLLTLMEEPKSISLICGDTVLMGDTSSRFSGWHIARGVCRLVSGVSASEPRLPLCLGGYL